MENLPKLIIDFLTVDELLTFLIKSIAVNIIVFSYVFLTLILHLILGL